MNSYITNIIDNILLEYNIDNKKFKQDFNLYINWIYNKLFVAEKNSLANNISNYNEYFISIFSSDFETNNINFYTLINNLHNNLSDFETINLLIEIINKTLNSLGFDYVKITKFINDIIINVDLYSRISKISDSYYYDIRKYKIEHPEYDYKSYVNKSDFYNYCIKRLENWFKFNSIKEDKTNSITKRLYMDKTYNPFSL